MDTASIAAAFVAAQAGQLQTAVAAKMLRMNAQASADTARDVGKPVEILAGGLEQFGGICRGSGIHAHHLGGDRGLQLAGLRCDKGRGDRGDIHALYSLPTQVVILRPVMLSILVPSAIIKTLLLVSR